MFSSPAGRPLRRNFYRRVFKPAVIAAGIDPDLRFHDLRHTYVALLIAQGAHVKEIAGRVGHFTPILTMRTYHTSSPVSRSASARSIREDRPDRTRIRAAKEQLQLAKLAAVVCTHSHYDHAVDAPL